MSSTVGGTWVAPSIRAAERHPSLPHRPPRPPCRFQPRHQPEEIRQRLVGLGVLVALALGQQRSCFLRGADRVQELAAEGFVVGHDAVIRSLEPPAQALLPGIPLGLHSLKPTTFRYL